MVHLKWHVSLIRSWVIIPAQSWAWAVHDIPGDINHVLWCPAHRWWCPHADCVKTKRRHYRLFFLLWKMSRMMLLILQSIQVFVCPILRSHGNRQPHFMNFKFIDDLKSGRTVRTRYRFVSTPGTFASFISRKTWVRLADLPKVCCKRSGFSAPRHRMSGVEGREVIVNNIKKIREVISESID